jgi:hypothetical protein
MDAVRRMTEKGYRAEIRQALVARAREFRPDVILAGE